MAWGILIRFGRVHRRATADESGFTLIELMVVVLILGILLTIALPTFMGARTRAQDAAAQATLRTALTAGRVIYVTSSARDPNDRYQDATIPELQAVESSITWVDESTVSSTPTIVSKDSTTGILYLASFSKSGKCFFTYDDPPFGTRYAITTGVTPSDCYAANTAGLSWLVKW